jgi:hypothetical protein
VYFLLDNGGYKHTLRIYNTYCFSTAKMVAQKRLSVTLDYLVISLVGVKNYCTEFDRNLANGIVADTRS